MYVHDTCGIYSTLKSPQTKIKNCLHISLCMPFSRAVYHLRNEKGKIVYTHIEAHIYTSSQFDLKLQTWLLF